MAQTPTLVQDPVLVPLVSIREPAPFTTLPPRAKDIVVPRLEIRAPPVLLTDAASPAAMMPL